jgi:hypothetical protein
MVEIVYLGGVWHQAGAAAQTASPQKSANGQRLARHISLGFIELRICPEPAGPSPQAGQKS